MTGTKDKSQSVLLQSTRIAKRDEFYTQYADIEEEVQRYLEYDKDVFKNKVVFLPCDDPDTSNFTLYFRLNFEEFGLRKLISTSYSKGGQGKISVMTEDNCTRPVTMALKGNGDFRSDEITGILEESDIVVTCPPFSLFGEFMEWIYSAGKKFLVMGNIYATTYEEVYPRIQSNRIWLGATGNGKDRVFGVPKDTAVSRVDKEMAEKMGYVGDYTRLGNTCWFTNLEHERRHGPIPLMTMADVFKYSKHYEIWRRKKFDRYDNSDAIDVPFLDSIPSDYEGVMGVPVLFLDRYCPEQFEIVRFFRGDDGNDLSVKGKCAYFRILIRKIQKS